MQDPVRNTPLAVLFVPTVRTGISLIPLHPHKGSINSRLNIPKHTALFVLTLSNIKQHSWNLFFLAPVQGCGSTFNVFDQNPYLLLQKSWKENIFF